MLYVLFDLLRENLDEAGLYWPFGVLDQVEFRALAALLLAFALVILLGKPTIKQLVRLKIGDTGQTDAEALRSHAASRRNVPTMGGLLIALAILGSNFLLADIREPYVYIGLLLVFWFSGIGFIDDYLKLTAAARGGGRQGLKPWEKLVAQLGFAALFGYFAFNAGINPEGDSLAHVINLPFQKTYDSGTLLVNEQLSYLNLGLYVVAMTLFTAGMSNAVNITDGMDGLASGCSASVALGLMVLALVGGQEAWSRALLVPYVIAADELGILAGATAGACLGFLWWNCAPASVFMGDTGSLCLGGIIGYIAIVIRQEIAVIIMSGVFLIEIGSVVAQVAYFRSTGGKRIFRCAPYHHHLHLGGWQEQQVVSRMWILSVLLVVAALATVKLR
ncbi:MAG: phospho-N-acetylmuramoyl-pentapeptide-transferase [Planctomycetota bacterium]